MKLVSSYDTAYEQHEREILKDHLRSAVSEAKDAQASLAQAVREIADLVECAEDVGELAQAEGELRDALTRLEALKVAVNYAAVLMREVGGEALEERPEP